MIFRLNNETSREERLWTKKDAFILMNCTTPDCYKGTQRLASWILLRKSLTSLRFVSEYLTYSQDPRILTDGPSVFGENDKDFHDHRHDQSVLSLLSKKMEHFSMARPKSMG